MSENGIVVASVRRKTPQNGKGPNTVLRLTPRQITSGIPFVKINPMALISAVIIFLPGGFENMNFLTFHPLKILRMAQNEQLVKIMTMLNILTVVIGCALNNFGIGI